MVQLRHVGGTGTGMAGPSKLFRTEARKPALQTPQGGSHWMQTATREGV